MVTAGASTPTVSQVGIAPGGGASSNRQRRHGVARDPPATVSHGAFFAGGVGQDGECRADRAHGSAVYVRNAVFNREIVGQVPRLEVIQAVDENVNAGCVSSDVAVVEIVDDRRHSHLGIDARDPAPGGFGLRHRVGDILLVEQYLPLQVRELNNIAIRDHQVADAGARKKLGSHTAERAAPKYQRCRTAQSLLPHFPETGKQRLAVVAGEVVIHIRVSHRSTRAPGSIAIAGQSVKA